MAMGNWRNWDEIECTNCGNLLYKKHAKRLKNSLYCASCYERIRPPAKKTIDSKIFTYWNTYASPTQANNVADTFRALGDLARVIHTKKGYELFLRDGDRKTKHKEKHPEDYIPDDWEMM